MSEQRTPAVASPWRDPESVYQVIQLVGSDGESWEGAASAAISEAAKSIVDLRVAQVVELDTQLVDGVVRAYRVRLKLSYRIDRRRVSAETGEARVVRRYLVVVNQAVVGSALTDKVSELAAAGPAEFHALVPAALSKEYAAARRLSTFGVDPMSGYTFGDLSPLAGPDEVGLRQAAERLSDQLESLRRRGIHPSGEVGDPDPLSAIGTVLSRASFDEILISTSPSAVSRWTRMDLPSRVERRFHLPVTHVSGEAEPAEGGSDHAP